MSFSVHQRLVNDVEPIVKLEVTANETIAAGEALVLSSGKLTKCGATAKPTYISVGVSQNGFCPVIRVTPNIYFETEASASQSALAPGSVVTLHTDGLSVTATTSSGVFTLTKVGAAQGDTCVGYFA